TPPPDDGTTPPGYGTPPPDDESTPPGYGTPPPDDESTPPDDETSPQPPKDENGGDLPVTGSGMLPLLAAAGGAVLAGLGLLAFVRRKADHS
ncbi:LPXTG cell wall anchor domain-containing protein, partial [Streptomonospora algeriensis]